VGLEDDGEVEDHEVEIACHIPDTYDMNQADANAAILTAGFNIAGIIGECNDTIAVGRVTRTDPPYCNYPECGSNVDIYVSTGSCCSYPVCWDWAGQCEGDAHGDDGDVDTDDFILFKAAFAATKGVDANYDPCADLDRDGDIDTDDFIVFKANFGEEGFSGCAQGDINVVYCP
jgi:hypothetical protein